MKTILHAANTRGHADHGWLNAYHSFSFANWRNSERDNFGLLRVLNDDTVAAGMGFGTHSHDNMEIITIPLEGDLAHKDSLGNAEIIKTGDIQVMSAGTGIRHSEFNPNANHQTRLLQIWIFPKKQNVTPRYQQISLIEADSYNRFQQVLSPNSNDDGVWIYQNAWFSLGYFDQETTYKYKMHLPSNGVYVFMIEGSAIINGQNLIKRDAIGIWDSEDFEIHIFKDTKILLIEIPMQ